MIRPTLAHTLCALFVTLSAIVAIAPPAGAVNSPLLSRALGEADFFARLDADPAFDTQMRNDLASAAFRKVGQTRSVRVQLWRGTATEMPAVVLEYQTAFKKFPSLVSGGNPTTSPVLIGTGRDSMWHRTFYGGTDDPEAHKTFEALLDQRKKMPSNKRNDLNPKFIELAEKYLPTRPLAEVRAELKALIEQLVDENKALGAQIIPDPQYGHFGAKINDHCYLYIRDFPEDAPTRFDHDPFLWLVVSGGPRKIEPYLPAFPGAQGAGARATGGRGGKVLYVTTLDTNGPGSLQEALKTKGARTILFKVSGQITIPDEMWIEEPNLTMIGYTAPGEGVEITGRLCMAADNVIFRGMRFRLRPPRSMDGMNTRGNLKNIIFDHCSLAYGSDEVMRFIGNGSTFLGFTIQYCVIGPGMAGLGSHPYGPEIGGYGSFHHNLFYNTLSRSPEVDCDMIDWSYNIMANLRSGHSLRPQSRFNMVGNYIVDMPGNRNAYSFNTNDAVYADGNLRETNRQASAANFREGSTGYLKKPYNTVPLTPTDPAKLEETLLPIAGAYLPKRDVTDTYFIEQFKQRKSLLPYWQKPGTVWKPYGNENDKMDLYQQWEEKNFPPPAPGAQAKADADNDGMPDAWETENKLNPNDAADATADADKDEYTNVEECLYRTNPNQAVDYTKAENNKHTLH